MNEGLLRQADLEALTAWIDGELEEPAAERVGRLVRTEAAWQATFEQFQAVDAAMARVGRAQPCRDLTDRIVRAARRDALWRGAGRIAAATAAAAAIALAIFLALPERPGGTVPDSIEQQVAIILKDVPEQDRFIVRNLSLFQQYEEVGRYEQVRQVADPQTLAALMELESGG